MLKFISFGSGSSGNCYYLYTETDGLIIYGAQNEAYKMMEGRKVGKVVSLQRVMRGLMVEAPQNETFTLV